MLIQCPECGQSISNLAPACPHCGVPIAAHRIAETRALGEPLTTVQATSQTIKGWIALFLLLLFSGLGITFTHTEMPSPIIAPLLIGIGFWGYVIMKIKQWWYHG